MEFSTFWTVIKRQELLKGLFLLVVLAMTRSNHAACESYGLWLQAGQYNNVKFMIESEEKSGSNSLSWVC
jgi:hypothetical protein